MYSYTIMYIYQLLYTMRLMRSIDPCCDTESPPRMLRSPAAFARRRAHRPACEAHAPREACADVVRPSSAPCLASSRAFVLGFEQSVRARLRAERSCSASCRAFVLGFEQTFVPMRGSLPTAP